MNSAARVVPAAATPKPRFGQQVPLFPVVVADEPLVVVGQECWILTDPVDFEEPGRPVLRRAVVTHTTPKYFCARTVREFGKHGPMVTLPPGIKKTKFIPFVEGQAPESPHPVEAVTNG